MTGPGTSIAAGSAGAVFVAGMMQSDAVLIAAFGGIGGLSRWLYFALNGVGEPWYKGLGHLVLSVLFVTGIFPIAKPIFGLLFGAGFVEAIAIDPSANLGVAYFIGMFTTVLIGVLEDRMRAKKRGAKDDGS